MNRTNGRKSDPPPEILRLMAVTGYNTEERGFTIDLQQAIADLYRTVVVKKAPTSTLRLRSLAEYCVEQLAVRGLAGAGKDRIIPGGGRPKEWDVAWEHESKYRLAISLKSILRNIAGTVPNRIDDLMGEVANVQMYSPEIVVGYIMVVDRSLEPASARHGSWCGLLRDRLTALSGRRSPAWSVGMVEAFSLIEVDFRTGPVILTPEHEVADMFDVLVREVVSRNPSLAKRGVKGQ